jgi:hypothetical protein
MVITSKRALICPLGGCLSGQLHTTKEKETAHHSCHGQIVKNLEQKVDSTTMDI